MKRSHYMNTHEYMKHHFTETILEAIKLPSSFLLQSAFALLHLQEYTSENMKPEVTKALATPISKLWDKATENIITTIQEYTASHFPSFIEPYLKQGKPIPPTTDAEAATKELIFGVVKHAAKYDPRIRKLSQMYAPTYI